MTTKLEQAARQVDKTAMRVEQDCEEALGEDGMVMVVPLDAYNDMMEAITALREALAEQAEQVPVALDEIRRIVAEYIEPNSQVDSGNLFWALCGALQYIDVNLKFNAPTHQVRTKDLTDDEISDVFDSVGSWKETLFGDLPVTFARAVIAADREKNK